MHCIHNVHMPEHYYHRVVSRQSSIKCINFLDFCHLAMTLNSHAYAKHFRNMMWYIRREPRHWILRMKLHQYKQCELCIGVWWAIVRRCTSICMCDSNGRFAEREYKKAHGNLIGFIWTAASPCKLTASPFPYVHIFAECDIKYQMWHNIDNNNNNSY